MGFAQKLELDALKEALEKETLENKIKKEELQR